MLQVSPPDVLCLPVLNIPRKDFSYFTETRFILEELNIPESFHIFRDEINLHQLNAEGKLSLTLINSNMLTRYCILDTTRCLTWVRAVLKVIFYIFFPEFIFISLCQHRKKRNLKYIFSPIMPNTCDDIVVFCFSITIDLFIFLIPCIFTQLRLDILILFKQS